MQIPVSQFSLSNLIRLLVVLLFFCGLTLGYRSIYLHDVPSQQSCSSRPQYRSPDGFTSALPVILLPLLQSPPQSIWQHPWISIEVKYWPFFLFSNIWTQLYGFHLCKLTYLVLHQFPQLVIMDFMLLFSTCDAFLQQDPWLNKAYCFSLTSSHTEHDIVWYRISLWPVWVSCPGYTPSQLLVHLLTGKAWETGESLNWSKHY